MNPLLETRNLSRSFGGLKAVEDVDGGSTKLLGLDVARERLNAAD